MYWQIPTPQQEEFPPFVQYKALLSPPECEAIIAAGESLGLYPGTIGNGLNTAAVEDKSYRQVKTTLLPPIRMGDSPLDLRWLYQRLQDRVQWTNRDYYGFDLNGFDEGIAFLKYEAGDQPGHYRWHQDFGGGPSSLRKLSIVAQLSKPTDYQGCELRMFTNCDFAPDTKGQGDVIIFPSWTPHMVTPIDHGVRYSLAIWVAGPRFR